MTRSGRAYPLPAWEHRTSATDSGSWPTPLSSKTSYGRGSRSSGGRTLPAEVKRFPTPTKIDASTSAERKRTTKGRHALGLAHLANGGVLTEADPVAAHVAQVQSKPWPTPTKRDGLGGPGASGRDGGLNLRTAVARASSTTNSDGRSRRRRGSLNPTWVEWLMGFPLGWTVLRRSETRSSRKS
jgi:hypothetical protein